MTNFAKEGYELVEDFLNLQQIDSFNRAAKTLTFPPKSGGIRNIQQKLSNAQELISSYLLLKAARQYLEGEPKFIRAILFKKQQKIIGLSHGTKTKLSLCLTKLK